MNPDDDVLTRLDDELFAESPLKIQAIKRLRQVTSLGLKEAKDHCDEAQRRGRNDGMAYLTDVLLQHEVPVTPGLRIARLADAASETIWRLAQALLEDKQVGRYQFAASLAGDLDSLVEELS